MPNPTVLYKPDRQQDRRTEQGVLFATSWLLFVVKSDPLHISFKYAFNFHTIINVTIYKVMTMMPMRTEKETRID